MTRAARTLFRAPGARPALALARPGARVGGPDHRVGGPAGFGGRVLRDSRIRRGGAHLAEVIGFRGSNVLSMPVETTEGIRFGDPVWALGVHAGDRGGPGADGQGAECAWASRSMGAAARRARRRCRSMARCASPLDRVPIREPLGTGIRAIDALLTVGRGQRVGIFGGSGVGKSTLIGMMTRNTEADVTVVGLVGERGREVGEFLKTRWARRGWRGRWWWCRPPTSRRCCACARRWRRPRWRSIFAAQGKHVLLVLDSLTRFAMAAREIGLAAGEPPTAKGYTPSVFTRLARLVERAGQFRTGSITAFYTVLMEGDDQQDPLVDAVRSLLDGHVVLSRALAAEGWYPPIEVLDSISRLMPAVAGAGASRAGGAGAQADGGLCALGGPGAHRRLQAGRGSGSGPRAAGARRDARISDAGCARAE